MPTAPFVAPMPLALVLCDSVYVEPQTQKKAIIGVFSALFAPSFPVVHPAMAIYLAMTDGQGKVPVRIRLVDSEEVRDPIFEVANEVVFHDRRMVSELIMNVGGLVFPAAGEYRVQTFAGDEPLLERRLVVMQPKPKQPNTPDPTEE